MTFKPWGPGYATGASNGDQQPEAVIPAATQQALGDSVSKAPKSGGGLGAGDMKASLKECANYNGGGENPTGCTVGENDDAGYPGQAKI
jgi:hypothetical protein